MSPRGNGPILVFSFGDPRLPGRFWQKVQPCPMSGCWLWTGGSARKGYGTFKVPRGPDRPRRDSFHSGHVSAVAHRVSFLAAGGEIPDGLVLDHLCRVTCCVNPLHLEPVTIRENARRGIPGVLTTHCPKGHPYDEANTQFSKAGLRRCGACNRERTARWKAARKAERQSIVDGWAAERGAVSL